MERLSLILEREHLLLIAGERRFVLDTGSPLSFGNGGEVTCDGHSMPLPSVGAGLSAGALSGILECPVDGLLGNDFIARFDWIFDLPNSVAVVSREPLAVAGTRVSLGFVQTVPVIQCQVAERSVSLLFDSGAKLSYLERSLTTGFPDAGTVHDFMPMFGAFTAATVWAPIDIHGRAFSFRFGIAPPLVQMALTMTGSSGIVGADLFRSCSVGYLPRRSELVLV